MVTTPLLAVGVGFPGVMEEALVGLVELGLVGLGELFIPPGVLVPHPAKSTRTRSALPQSSKRRICRIRTTSLNEKHTNNDADNEHNCERKASSRKRLVLFQRNVLSEEEVPAQPSSSWPGTGATDTASLFLLSFSA